MRIRKLVEQIKIFLTPERSPTRNDSRGSLQVRSIRITGLSTNKARVRRKFDGTISRFDRSRIIVSRCLVGRRSNRGHEDLVGRGLDGSDRVARVDRPLERIRPLDAHDVADLVDAKQGRHARHQVLAKRRRRTEDMRVTVRKRDYLRSLKRRYRVHVFCTLSCQHAIYAVDLRGLCGNICGRFRQDQNVDFSPTKFGRAGHTFCRLRDSAPCHRALQ